MASFEFARDSDKIICERPYFDQGAVTRAGFYFEPDAGQLLTSPAEELDIAIGIDRRQPISNIPVRRVNHKWAGLRTFAPDKSFVIGFDPRAIGFFWCARQGGYVCKVRLVWRALAGN